MKWLKIDLYIGKFYQVKLACIIFASDDCDKDIKLILSESLANPLILIHWIRWTGLITVPWRGRVLPGTWGKWVTRERQRGRPSPPDKERDKQSNPSQEGGIMEQEEEAKKSQSWRRGPSVHRVSIVEGPLSMYKNVINLFNDVDIDVMFVSGE